MRLEIDWNSKGACIKINGYRRGDKTLFKIKKRKRFEKVVNYESFSKIYFTFN